MTPGERMVWAAVFATKRDSGKSVAESVRFAALEVKNLRTLAIHDHLLEEDDDARAMLRDMVEVVTPGCEIKIPATANGGFHFMPPERSGR